MCSRSTSFLPVCGADNVSSCSGSDEERSTLNNQSTVKDDIDLTILEMEIMSAYMNKRLKGDEKCYRYYMAVERYLYKKDPSIKTGQFKFEIQALDSGEVTHVFKPGGESQSFKKYYKHIPSILGSVVGASVIIARFCGK